MPEYFVTRQKSPALSIVRKANESAEVVFKISHMQYNVCILLKILNVSHQVIADYSRFILIVNEPPKSFMRIVYYSVNQKLITEYGTSKRS